MTTTLNINRKPNTIAKELKTLIQDHPNSHFHVMKIQGPQTSKNKLVTKLEKIMLELNTGSNKKWFYFLDYWKNKSTATIYDAYEASLYALEPTKK